MGRMYACLSCLLRNYELLQVESYFFDIRRQLFEYDQVMNTQRDKVRTHTYLTCIHCNSKSYMLDSLCRDPLQLALI